MTNSATIAAQPDLFDDDLFAVAPLTIRATTARVTCQVCGLVAEVPIFSPARLCGPCSADPESLRDELVQRQQTLVEKQATAWNGFEQLVSSLDTKQAERWANIKIARSRGVKADKIAAIAADATDPLYGVLKMEAETPSTLNFYAERLVALQRGIDELSLIVKSDR